LGSTADATAVGARARGVSTGAYVHRSASGAPEVTPVHSGSGGGQAKKRFSFALWSPFRNGDRPPSTAANPKAEKPNTEKPNTEKPNETGPTDDASKVDMPKAAYSTAAGSNAAGTKAPAGKAPGTKDTLSKGPASNEAGPKTVNRKDAKANDKGAKAKDGASMDLAAEIAPNAPGRTRFATSASVLSKPSGSKPDPKSSNQPSVAAPSNADKAANASGQHADKPVVGSPSENGAPTQLE
jgi:hypothetical protein